MTSEKINKLLEGHDPNSPDGGPFESQLVALVRELRAEVERLKVELAKTRGFPYPHFCRNGHENIGHANSGDDERCPLCQVIDERDALCAENAELRDLLEKAQSLHG